MKQKLLYSYLFLIPAIIFGQSTSVNTPLNLLVGTYTSGESKGIYVCHFNPATASIELVDSTATSNPSYLSVSPGQDFVYAVNEQGGEHTPGMITAFHYNKKLNKLQKLNEQLTGGSDPCYISTDKTGKWIVAGNYSSGSFSLFEVNASSGKPGHVVWTVSKAGKSVDKDRQQSPHVHCTIFSQDNKFLFVSDLGDDSIYSYRFNELTGAVIPTGGIAVMPGAGPRHIIFNATGSIAYLTEEMSGAVSWFNCVDGNLKYMGSVNAFPDSAAGKRSLADLHISPDGKFLYTSNRAAFNAISIFSIDSMGTPKLVSSQSCLGKTPRNFIIDPTGKFLLVANQDSNEIIVFKRDIPTGKLTFTGNRLHIGNPVCLKWIK